LASKVGGHEDTKLEEEELKARYPLFRETSCFKAPNKKESKYDQLPRGSLKKCYQA